MAAASKPATHLVSVDVYHEAPRTTAGYWCHSFDRSCARCIAVLRTIWIGAAPYRNCVARCRPPSIALLDASRASSAAPRRVIERASREAEAPFLPRGCADHPSRGAGAAASSFKAADRGSLPRHLSGARHVDPAPAEGRELDAVVSFEVVGLVCQPRRQVERRAVRPSEHPLCALIVRANPDAPVDALRQLHVLFVVDALEEILRRIESYAQRFGKRWAPAPATRAGVRGARVTERLRSPWWVLVLCGS